MPLRPLIDAVAFSSLLAAAVGFALSIVASRSMAAPQPLRWALLAATGTFIIYNLDRLRDTAADHATSPQRTAFVERHHRILRLSVLGCSLAFAAILVSAPTSVQLLCVGIGTVGLLHRRLKGSAALKTTYVSLAWVASCVGMPWLAGGRPTLGYWVAAIHAPILAANLIASNLRDHETQILRERPERAIHLARAAALLALLLVFAAPRTLAPLGWIALAEGLALLGFREGERYGLLIIDGALLAGSLAACIHFSMLA